MLYQWLANLVVVVHALLVLGFVVGVGLIWAGWLPHRRRLEIAFWLLMALGWGFFLIWRDCPLTLLENFLRAQVDPASTYATGCITHYLTQLGIPITDRWVNRAGLILLLLAMVGTLYWHLHEGWTRWAVRLGVPDFPLGRTLLLGACFMGMGMTLPIFNHFVPIFLKEMALPAVLITFVLTWDNYINMFVQPVVGTLSDRTCTRIGRRKPWVLAGSPVAATAFLLVPMMATPSGVMFTIFLTNLGMALFRSPGVALIGDIYPSGQRSFANGIINLMVGLGAALAYYVGGLLYGLYGRHAPFLFGSAVMWLALGVILLFVSEPARLPGRDEVHDEAGLRESLMVVWRVRNPSLRWMLLAVFCWFMSFTALEALLSLYGKQVLGIPPDQMGRLVAILAFMVVLFAVPSGWLATRFGRKRVIRVGVLGLVGLLLYGFFVQSSPMLVGFLVPAGICWALINVNALPTLYDTTPQLRAGVLTGLYYFASNLAAVAGPQLAGLLVDLSGDNYRVVFLYGACFMGLAALCLRQVRSE